jgi:hypothetical protein
VLPELAERVVFDETSRRLGEDDLAPVCGRGDAGSAVDVHADVALVGDDRLAGVDADAHANRAGFQGAARVGGGRDCVGGTREGNEEGIALRVDLDSALGSAGLSDQPPMLGECLRVRLCAQLVEQPGRALDVREEERDSAGGKRGHGPTDHDTVLGR